MSLLDTASLIVTPNGYKEGKLYSVIPSDGSGDLSVTRATTATRVNSAGLVELVPYNLLQYSQEFDNAVWILENATITANASTAPNGTMTADKLAEDSSLNKHDVYYGNNSGNGTIVSSGNLYTISIYAKAAERDFMQIAFGTGQVSGNPRVNFNISTGVVSAVDNGITATIENVGNGWYRCVASVTAATGFLTFVAQTQTSGTATRFATYTGTTGSGIYIWGAQLVEGSVAKDYQKTETRLNIPRLDYSNGTCPSILVEPQRTNLITYSSSFDNAAWFKENASVSANTTTSPDGTQNADSLVENGATSEHLLYQPAISSAGVYTQSVFMKKNTRQYGFIQIATDGASNRYTIVVDLDNGAMTASSTMGLPSGTSYKIDSIGNGWYRLSVTAIHTIGTLYSVFGLSNSATPTFNSLAIPTYSGNGTSSVYFYGAQLEAGSYATSYIPTTSASVTRNADVISKTGISSLIGQTEGTLFLDFYYDGSVNNHMIIRDPSYSTYIYFNSQNANQLWGQIQNVGIQFSMSATAGRYKMALAYKSGSSALYVNGAQIGTSSTTFSVVGTMSELDYTLSTPNNKINASALWKTRLTNTQLAQLTTI